jgi:hypothetical protein
MNDYSVSNVIKEINNNQEIAQNIDISNVVIHKNYQFSLFASEFPLFSLKLDKKISEYKFTNKNGTTITINSTKFGRATMQDADLWLYCITKMMQLIYEEKTLTRRIVFTGYDYLKKTGRNTAGPNYQQIIDSLQRLSSTRLETNKTIETWKVGAGLGLIDSYGYIKDEKTGKTIRIEVVLPEWLYTEVLSKKIVTINPKYLELKPLEKRLYQLAKIHCRNSQNTEFSLNYFAKKVGSFEVLRNFRIKIKKIQKTQPLPDFLIHYDQKEDKVRFTLREQNDADKSQVKSRMKSKELRNKSQDKFIEKRIYEIAKINQKMNRLFNTIFTTKYFLKHLELQDSDSKDLMAKIKKMQETQPFSEFLIHCVEDQIWFTSYWKEKDNSNVKIESEKGLTAFNKIAQKFTANTADQEAKLLKSTAKIKKVNSAEIREIKDQVRYVLKELDKRYPDKKQAIFSTDILTEKRLFNYIKEFGVSLLLDVIAKKADFDFSATDNSAGYLWGILKNLRNK